MLRGRVLTSWIACVLLTGSAVPCPASTSAPSATSTRLELPTKPEEDPHVAMRKLLAEIELRMRETDRLLSNAAGAARAPEADGVGSLLARGHASAQRVVDDIDRLLELAHHPHPPGGT